MNQPAHPERISGPSASLDEQIFAAEQEVIRRDEAVRLALSDTTEALQGQVGRARERVRRSGTQIGVVVAAAAVAGFALQALFGRGRPRHASRERPTGRRRDADEKHQTWLHRAWGLAMLAAPLLPLPAQVRRFLPRRSRFGFAGLLLPLLRHVLPEGPGASDRPMRTMSLVDLERIAGRWFEYARLPDLPEKGCASDAQAYYAPRGDGGVAVANRCVGRDGREREVHGVARVIEGSGHARLKVSFAPSFLQFLPFVWADYWILHVDEGYRHALVGTPDRRYLWLLSRTPEMPRETVAQMVGIAQQEGFPIGRLIRVAHGAGVVDDGAP